MADNLMGIKHFLGNRWIRERKNPLTETMPTQDNIMVTVPHFENRAEKAVGIAFS